MALLLSQEDLRGLTRDPVEVRKAIDAVEASVRASHGSGAGQVIFGDLALDNAAYLKVLGSSAPQWGMSLQSFPAQANDTVHPDSRVMLLFGAATGSLLGVFAGDELAALRTSVPAALGARHLAPAGAEILGILGSGYQAASHALTISAAVPGLREILVWSPTKAHRERFAREQERLGPLPVRACADAQEVVETADIVTATGRTAAGDPAFPSGWVKPGALLISMTRATPRDLDASARFVVPTRRRPELVAFGFSGPSAPRPAADPEGTVELVDVLDGRVWARQDPQQPVVWELANVYLWDLAILRWAHEWAVHAGAGRRFALTDGTSGP